MTKEEIEKVAQHAWGAAQRLGMQIAEKPRAQREQAFAIVEQCLRDTARTMNMSGEEVEGLMKFQMEAVRGMVMNIDGGGSPQGGHA